MKNRISTIASILAATLIATTASSAHALTNEDIAGVYRGTSVAMLPSGQTVSAMLTVTLKPSGKEKVTSVVNGQTSSSKGSYQFVSGDAILGTFPNSEFVAFVEQNGGNLTLTILANEGSGIYVSEKTTLTLTQKL